MVATIFKTNLGRNIEVLALQRDQEQEVTIFSARLTEQKVCDKVVRERS